jgi:hypothetical protein
MIPELMWMAVGITFVFCAIVSVLATLDQFNQGE